MKVLLFTHSQDIDGMGCAILARKAFSDYTLVPTKTFDITKNVKEYIDNGKIYEYDQIFVTDLCVKEPVLNEIDLNDEIKRKFIILDHHKTEIEEGNDKYSFVNIIVTRNGIKESGTSIFYKYLVEHNFIKKSCILDELVEWTRQYDVYDWKKINNQNARYLHILFENLGYEKYLELINDKVDNNSNIVYNEFEKSVVNDYFNRLDETARKALDEMRVVEITIDNKIYRIGYVFCEYKYRNDLNEYVIKDNKYNIDLIGMIMTDTDTVSYRCVKEMDASLVGKYFGGKGHKGAATNSQSNETFKKLVLRKTI